MINLGIKFGEPYKIDTKFGDQYCREWLIPVKYRSQFFDYWRKNSFDLKSKGFNVSKRDVEWYLLETHPFLHNFKGFEDKKPVIKESTFFLAPQEVKTTTGLRPWQVDSVGKLCAAMTEWNGTIDGSEMGVGKTYSAIGVVRELNVDFVIICPKAVISQWRNVIDNHFKIKDKCVGIINYESLIRGKSESPVASYIKNKKTHKEEFIWKLPKDSVIIWDEAHKLKNFKTKNSKTCMKAHKQGIKQIFLSASIATTPLELRTIGTCLQMFKTSKDYYNFLYANGCTKGRWGMQFNNDKNALKGMHKALFSDRGTRLRRDEIPNFPECEVQVDPYNLDDADTKKINQIYDEMQQELKKIEKRIKKDSENELTIRLRARQKTEIIKVPLIQEMVEESLEAGMSVVVFLNFSDSIDALAERLNTKCIFDGRCKDDVREQNKKDFQANTERVIIINAAAGGVGLSIGDETGEFPRISLISPDDSAFKMKQVQGRTVRENSKSKSIIRFIFISNTIEETVAKNVKQKLDNLDLLNDGDLKL